METAVENKCCESCQALKHWEAEENRERRRERGRLTTLVSNVAILVEMLGIIQLENCKRTPPPNLN